MQLFASASNRQINVALTLLRVVVGAIFIAHGGQKLFVFGLEGIGARALGRQGARARGERAIDGVVHHEAAVDHVRQPVSKPLLAKLRNQLGE